MPHAVATAGVPVDPPAPAGRADLRAWIAVGLWLACAVTALAWFDTPRASGLPAAYLFDPAREAPRLERWYQASSPPAARASASALTLVHLYTPGCACNARTETHLREIEKRYGAQGLTVRRLSRRGQAAAALGYLPSMPVALLFDAAGHLRYVGPYSSTAWCGVGRGPIEPLLEALIAGRSAEPTLQIARGCACPTV